MEKYFNYYLSCHYLEFLLKKLGKTNSEKILPVSLYPNLKEGDVLEISDSEISYATEEAKARINNAKKGLNKIDL